MSPRPDHTLASIAYAAGPSTGPSARPTAAPSTSPSTRDVSSNRNSSSWAERIASQRERLADRFDTLDTALDLWLRPAAAPADGKPAAIHDLHQSSMIIWRMAAIHKTLSFLVQADSTPAPADDTIDSVAAICRALEEVRRTDDVDEIPPELQSEAERFGLPKGYYVERSAENPSPIFGPRPPAATAPDQEPCAAASDPDPEADWTEEDYEDERRDAYYDTMIEQEAEEAAADPAYVPRLDFPIDMSARRRRELLAEFDRLRALHQSVASATLECGDPAPLFSGATRRAAPANPFSPTTNNTPQTTNNTPQPPTISPCSALRPPRSLEVRAVPVCPTLDPDRLPATYTQSPNIPHHVPGATTPSTNTPQASNNEQQTTNYEPQTTNIIPSSATPCLRCESSSPATGPPPPD